MNSQQSINCVIIDDEPLARTGLKEYLADIDFLNLVGEFDNALARLDSVTGSNNNLQGQLTDRQKEIDAKKSEIRKILNDKNATQSQLAKARTMIADLNEKIGGLEAEVARLSGENQ